jgi:hypothetical protein
LFAIFCSYGCLIKVFDHEASINLLDIDQAIKWGKTLSSLPVDFKSYLEETSLVPEETTFYIWRSYTDDFWNSTETDFSLGSKELLSLLNSNQKQYKKWAEEYYKIIINIEFIQHIFSHKILDRNIFLALNPQAVIDDIHKDLQEIGYISSL